METKVCTQCKLDLSITEYYVQKNRNNRLTSRCKSCSTKNNRERHKNNLEYSRAYNRNKSVAFYAQLKLKLAPEELRERNYRKTIRHRYGVDSATYDRLLKEHNNICGICGHHPKEYSTDARTERLYIDHCHTTGAVRGLLCSKCNYALERIEIDPEWGTKAIAYLNMHR